MLEIISHTGIIVSIGKEANFQSKPIAKVKLNNGEEMFFFLTRFNKKLQAKISDKVVIEQIKGRVNYHKIFINNKLQWEER